MQLLPFVATAALLLLSANGWYYGRPEPDASTKGGVWPLPWKMTSNDEVEYILDPKNFTFLSNQDIEILKVAFKRYKRLTFPDYKNESDSNEYGTLTKLNVHVANVFDGDDYPTIDMDETYTLKISPNSDDQATLEAHSVWGALRGLETFSQLVYQNGSNRYRIHATTIEDKPRFKHRGTLVDSSRHFLSVGVLKQHLDLMAQNKMNVFHWHLVDSEAFPYPSKEFPELSEKGAYSNKHKYTSEQVESIIKYARNRGIRVVPEFDTPGHMGGWRKGREGLLSKCADAYGREVLPNIIDPTKEENFNFLEKFFTEAFATFKDRYMHFGGDEVSTAMLQCWRRNSEVRAWMREHNFEEDTYKLLNYYFQRLFNITNKIDKNMKMIVWQEVLDNNVTAPGVIAHVWKGETYEGIMAEMKAVTEAGHDAILSSCWYLNYIKYGSDWGYLDHSNLRLRGLYYQCDPTDFEGSDEQKKHVLGGEAAMWGEYVDGTNLIQRMWPRASAVAERLWSDPAQTKDADEAWPRLHEHRCRMLRRGFPVQPINNPNFCPVFWDPQFKYQEE